MGDLIRLLYLVAVILPLAVLFIGPLLVLAALRGGQRVGPIILDPGRRGGGGRVLALLVGLLLWLTVWGGLGMLLNQARLPKIAGAPPPTPAEYPKGTGDDTPTVPPPATRGGATPTSTPTATPSPTPRPRATATPTSPPMEATPPPSPTPPPVPPTATPSPLPPTPTATTTFTPAATLSPDQTAQAIAVVETANELLRAAVIQPSIGNLAALESLWRGEALAKAQAFAQDLYQRYLRPLEVTFVYLTPPVAIEGASPDTVIVISTEAWTYVGPRASHRESFEFTYTLSRQDGGWAITDYAYRYVPSSLSPQEGDLLSTALTTATITATTPITGQ